MERRYWILLILAIILVVFTARDMNYSGTHTFTAGNAQKCMDECIRIGQDNKCKAISPKFMNQTIITESWPGLMFNFTTRCDCKYDGCKRQPGI